MSVAEFLQTVQDQVIEQIPHEHYGLQHIRRLRPDALEACELRTGLVLHPRTGNEAVPDETYPTSKLVPASDEQAAQEALKFNTYALMLVCAIDTQGFAVMASFNSPTIDMPTIQRVLTKFTAVVKGLCDKMGALVGQFTGLSSEDEAALQPLYESASTQSVLQDFPGADAAYIINPTSPSTPLAPSAVGELVLVSNTTPSLPSIASPSWIPSPVVYRTGKLARYISSSIQLPSTPVPVAIAQPNKENHRHVPQAAPSPVTITSSKLETVYLHKEPLREWKIQAYISPDNDTLTLEVVTFESWAPVARELLDEVCEAAAFLMGDSQAELFPQEQLVC